MRNSSKIAADWWDYTTLRRGNIKCCCRAYGKGHQASLKGPGFAVKFYDTIESFYLAEALEYISCWKQVNQMASPAGICGPIGPTEQLPLVAQLVNDLEIDIKNGHFWAMDEWYINGKEVPLSNRPFKFCQTQI